jgi:hypothetical protein
LAIRDGVGRPIRVGVGNADTRYLELDLCPAAVLV